MSYSTHLKNATSLSITQNLAISYYFYVVSAAKQKHVKYIHELNMIFFFKIAGKHDFRKSQIPDTAHN